MKTLVTIDDPTRSESFLLGPKLGAGAFGSVYEAFNEFDRRYYAIKLSSSDSYDRSMYNEYQVYERLNQASHHDYNYPAAPNAYYCGRVQFGRDTPTALVMDRLGPSLEKRLAARGGRMHLSTVLTLGVQAVRALRAIHDSGFVHCDVKPDNMVMDRTHNRRLYFVDFGLTQPYRSHAHGEHVKLRHGNHQKAVAMFASLHWHEGIIASRRDDLESLAYVLIYLYRGELPWEGMDVRETWKCKRQYPLAKLCRGMSTAMVNFVMHVRGLLFEARPDYEYLEGLLLRALDEFEYSEDSRVQLHHSPVRSKEVSRRRTSGSRRRRRPYRQSRSYSRTHAKHRH